MSSESDQIEQYEDDIELNDALEYLDAVEREHGVESDAFVEALCSVGKLLHTRHNFLDALGYFIRGRAVLETREEQLHPLMSQLLAGIGENYLLQEMYPEALPYYEKAVSVLEALCMAENEDTARLLMKAGELQVMQGELFTANEHFTRAYQILCEVSPEHYELLGDVCHNFGVLLLTEKHFDRAYEVLRKGTEYRLKAFGDLSLERADSLVALAAASTELGNHRSALEHLYTALEIRSQILGEDDPLVHDAKARYTSVSQLIEQTTSIPDAVMVSKPGHAPDLEVLFALISTAALAVRREQGELALKLLELSKEALQTQKEIPQAVLAEIERLVAAM